MISFCLKHKWKLIAVLAVAAASVAAVLCQRPKPQEPCTPIPLLVVQEQERPSFLTPLKSEECADLTRLYDYCDLASLYASIRKRACEEARKVFEADNYGDYLPKTSLAAQVFLGMCAYYNDRMRADTDSWYNSNRVKVTKVRTFAEMLEAPVKGANCNSLTNWAMVDMHVFSGKHGIYGDKNHQIHNYNDGHPVLKPQIDRAFTLIETDGKRLKDMIADDELKSGDILFTKYHTLVYRGEGTVYASAGDSIHHRDEIGMVFDSWEQIAENSYNWNKKFYYILRFRDNYVPRYYRSKSGETKENPVYTALRTA